jgi:hypothetical protein
MVTRGLLGGAELAEPVRPEAQDLGQVGQRLDVVDQGRGAVDAALERPWRRAGGHGRPSVQPVDQRRLLAGDVSRWDGRQPDRHAGLRAAALGQGLPDGVERGGGGLVDADDHLAGADRGSRQQRAVEHQVWGHGEQQLVLAAAGLALGAVDHHHRRTPALADGAQLDPGREAGAASTAEAGPLDGGDQLVSGPAGPRRRRIRQAVPRVRDGPAPPVDAHQQAGQARRSGQGRGPGPGVVGGNGWACPTSPGIGGGCPAWAGIRGNGRGDGPGWRGVGDGAHGHVLEASRGLAGRVEVAARRQQAAAATVTMARMSMASIQSWRLSLPMPNPCTRARGQQA